MNYKVIDKETYYRKGVYRHFTEDCKCSTSMTARIDVTELVRYSKDTGTKFYLNFLYLLSNALNSRDDYKMDYLYKTDELICYDVIHPCHYVFHEDTETCTTVHSEYCEDYKTFYGNALRDLENAKFLLAKQAGMTTFSKDLFVTGLAHYSNSNKINQFGLFDTKQDKILEACDRINQKDSSIIRKTFIIVEFFLIIFSVSNLIFLIIYTKDCK